MNIMKLFKMVLSFLITALFFNIIFWFTTWLMEEPFEPLGWFSMPLYFASYPSIELRIDYVIYTIAILVYLALPILVSIVVYVTFFDKRSKTKRKNLKSQLKYNL